MHIFISHFHFTMTSWSRLFVYDDLGTTDSAGETTLVTIRPQTLYAFALNDAFDIISPFYSSRFAARFTIKSGGCILQHKVD